MQREDVSQLLSASAEPAKIEEELKHQSSEEEEEEIDVIVA